MDHSMATRQWHMGTRSRFVTPVLCASDQIANKKQRPGRKVGLDLQFRETQAVGKGVVAGT